MNGRTTVSFEEAVRWCFAAVGIEASNFADGHYFGVVEGLILSSCFSRISSFWRVCLSTV